MLDFFAKQKWRNVTQLYRPQINIVTLESRDKQGVVQKRSACQDKSEDNQLLASGKSRQVMTRCVVPVSFIQSSLVYQILPISNLVITLSLFIWTKLFVIYPPTIPWKCSITNPTFGGFVEKYWRRVNFGGGGRKVVIKSEHALPPGSQVFLTGSQVFFLGFQVFFLGFQVFHPCLSTKSATTSTPSRDCTCHPFPFT